VRENLFFFFLPERQWW